MKIMMLCPAYSIHSVKWLNAMARRGHEVHSCFCKGQEDKASIIDDNVIHHVLPIRAPYGYYLNIFSLQNVVKKVLPDIIHVHRASSYATLCRLAGVRCDVLSIWGSDVYEFPYKSSFNKHNLEKNLLYGKQLASTSGVMAEQAKLFLLDKNKQIEVTPFGVDINLFKPNTSPHETLVIGTVKTLNVKYGIDITIKAFSKALHLLKETGHEEIANRIKYYIYGRGPLRDDLQALIDRLGLTNVVTLCGYIQNTDVPKHLQAFDIFLLGSRSESFGVAAVEAMAVGVPVIATKVPGFSEVIEDEKTGLLVDIDDDDTMCLKLCELILDADKRKMLAKNGRERVLRLYNWANNVSQMEEIYKRCLKYE